MQLTIYIESPVNVWEILNTFATLAAVMISLYIIIHEKYLNNRTIKHMIITTLRIIKYYIEEVETVYKKGKPEETSQTITKALMKIRERINFVSHIDVHNYSIKRQNEISNFIIVSEKLFSFIEEIIVKKNAEEYIIKEDNFKDIYTTIDLLITTYEKTNLVSDTSLLEEVEKVMEIKK